MKGRNATLDPKASLVARKIVKLNGRQYQIGDPIADTTVDFRTKSKLYRVGVITTVEDFELSRNKYGRVINDAEPVEEVAEVEEVGSEEVSTEVEQTEEKQEEEETVVEEATNVAVTATYTGKRKGRPKRNA